jgi:hypothetical protein
MNYIHNGTYTTAIQLINYILDVRINFCHLSKNGRKSL